MAYDKGLVLVERLVGGALSGWSLTTGASRTGELGDERSPVRFAAVTVNDGYSIGNSGELSLDPATATATVIDYVMIKPGGNPAYGSAPYGAGRYGQPYGGLELPPINKGDRIEVSYDGVVIMAGMCTAATATFAPTGDALERGKHAERRTVAQFASVQRLMLQSLVSWPSLPQEAAITRLQRWFTVTIADGIDPQLLTVPMPAQDDAGTATLLDIARAFSEYTRIPVRTPGILSPNNWPSLSLVRMDDDPAPGLDDATEWVTEVEYTNARPSSMAVKGNDTRLAGPFAANATGPSTFVYTGFRAPGRVDAFGRTVTAYRVTQTFGPAYSAAIEVM